MLQMRGDLRGELTWCRSDRISELDRMGDITAIADRVKRLCGRDIHVTSSRVSFGASLHLPNLQTRATNMSAPSSMLRPDSHELSRFPVLRWPFSLSTFPYVICSTDTAFMSLEKLDVSPVEVQKQPA